MTWPRPHMLPAYEVVSKMDSQVGRQTISIGKSMNHKAGTSEVKGGPNLSAKRSWQGKAIIPIT